MTELAGSTALVTGGGRGLGREIALGLARAGAAVGVVSRTAGELDQTVALVRAQGGTAVAATADVSDAAQVATAVDSVRQQLGPIDLLVNNAGVRGPSSAFAAVDLDEWWRTMELNLGSVVSCTRLVLPEMVERGRGRIVNITSQAGVFRWPLASAYSVSKGAVVKLTENVAAEVSRHGIQVFSFHPGLLPIGFTAAIDRSAIAPGSADEKVAGWVLRERAEGRGAATEDAVAYVVALASGRADALSGRHLSVDDDLDLVLANLDDVAARDLHTLRVRRYTDTG